jgi:RecJ-like exonuclease
MSTNWCPQCHGDGYVPAGWQGSDPEPDPEEMCDVCGGAGTLCDVCKEIEKMGRCKDCALWLASHNDPSEGQCTMAEGRNGAAGYVMSRAWALDDMEYGATLVTRDNFGCVQFAPRGHQ